jgi:hypothetical protein
MDKHNTQNGMELISPAFRDNADIPPQYTCKGQNISPPLNIFNVPPNIKSLALILHDPDAVSGDYLHWSMWDIPPNTETISVNSVPTGAVQGPNDSGKKGYMGPCPPAGTGTHHYIFELYALDSILSLDQDTSREKLESAMQDHILAKATLTGLFKAD